MSKWRFPDIWVPLNHPFYFKIFHYIPTIFGYPYFRQTQMLVKVWRLDERSGSALEEGDGPVPRANVLGFELLGSGCSHDTVGPLYAIVLPSVINPLHYDHSGDDNIYLFVYLYIYLFIYFCLMFMHLY
jgi:hypothetical protein